MKLHVINSPTFNERFSLAARRLQINSIYVSPNAVFDNSLFQLNRETSYLFKTSI